MEQLIINKLEDEIKRFKEILEIEDKDNKTLQAYKPRYEIIVEYLENLLIEINRVINNPVVRKKYYKGE